MQQAEKPSEKIRRYRKMLHEALDDPKTSEKAKRKAQRALKTINSVVQRRNAEAEKIGAKK